MKGPRGGQPEHGGTGSKGFVGRAGSPGGSFTMAATRAPTNTPTARKFAKRVDELGDWRGKTLARMRQLIHDADPEVVEEWKWVKPTNPGVPVWSHDGIICTGETYKEVVKLTFFRGAALPDPKKLFNAGFGGNTRRAIDIREGDKVDEAAFKRLVKAAVTANTAVRPRRAEGKR